MDLCRRLSSTSALSPGTPGHSIDGSSRAQNSSGSTAGTRRHFIGTILTLSSSLAFGACATSSPSNAGPVPEATPIIRDVILATTTSTQDSGLLDALAPRFEQTTGYRLKPVSIGTGAALAIGARGEADVVLVHAPEAEMEWMAQGYGTGRFPVMHNDFVVLGPPGDPAGIAGQVSVLEVLRRISASGATGGKGVVWISRDDRSGTHQLELSLWQEAGERPDGTWYVTSGQGMGATVTLADQKRAYTLSDRATFLARRHRIDLHLLVEGDARLMNPYHVMPVNPEKFPQARLNSKGASAFAHFLLSAETQRLIASFGTEKYGQPLFFPDAVPVASGGIAHTKS